MENGKTGKEKRQNERFTVLSLVRCTVLPGNSSFVANIRNISLGGMAFFSDLEIAPKTALKLDFLPSNREKPVETQGEVVRCAPTRKNFEIGVRFQDISKDAKLAIQELEALFLRNRWKTGGKPCDGLGAKKASRSGAASRAFPEMKKLRSKDAEIFLSAIKKKIRP
jgi:hypothetical protein